MHHKRASSPYILKFTPPLHGEGQPLAQLRVAVKDLFHMAGYPTTAGNPDWLKTHEIPSDTSPVVTVLQNNGASIVGKTITDELAYSLNGQNIHYGTPINPRNPALLPGGSSSGSAVAVAEGSADIGLGTDTGGSIRVPASYNGLFGLRPSHGVVSTEQMVGLAPSFDTVGWMTRDLVTLSKVADVLLTALEQTPIGQIVRLGYSSEINSACAQQSSINKILETTKTNGSLTWVELSSVLNFNNLEKVAGAFRTLQGAEIWATHGQWIEKQQPTFAADIAARFAWCRDITPEQQQQAVIVQQLFKQQMDNVLTQVDFIVLPTTPGSAPALNLNKADLASYRDTLLSMTCIAGMAGLPQLHLPLKEQINEPMGISIIGAKYQDHQLLAFAKTFLDLM
jgi:amidase